MSIDRFDVISTEINDADFTASVSQRKLVAMQQPVRGNEQPPAPMMAPPNFSPPIPAWQNGARGIRGCINRNTYIWLVNGNSFWFFPTFVSRQAVIGFRWRGFGWIYQRINLNTIRSFQCF